MATVGGPTFIYDFKYNPSNESVYYTLYSESGRGCPPLLMKMSLNSGKIDTVFSCDEGEKLIEGNGYQFNPVNAAIDKITGNFKRLIPINLKSNKIAADVVFVNHENIMPDVPEITKANFTISIFQDGKKITDFKRVGCNVDQPFVFEGYAIPGFDKKIVLLLSSKGDCWEGGYINESLHVVGGVSNLDKTYLNSYKGASALVPNEGTLVVYESESVSNPVEVPSEPVKTSPSKRSAYAIIAVILGLGLGYLFGRKNNVRK